MLFQNLMLFFPLLYNTRSFANKLIFGRRHGYYHLQSGLTGGGGRVGMWRCDTPPEPLHSRQDLEKVGKSVSFLFFA